MGALVCADGRYYHEWLSNDAYQSADEVISENKEEILSELRQLKEMEDGEEKQEWLREIGCETVPTEEQYLADLTEKFNAERIEAGVFKFKSTAPDIEGQDEDPGVPLANGICQHCGQPKDQHHAKGALSSLNLAENNLGERVLPEGWEQTDYAEWTHSDGAKVTENPGKPEGVIAIANALPDMRALSSANLLMNDIGTEQAQALANILKEHATLKSLCGNKGDETELDMSGKGMRMWDAIMLAPEIADNGALSVLSLKDNRLATKEGGKALAQALANNSTLKELDVSSNVWKEYGYDKGDGPGFAQELAVGIKDNGALSSLNLASNFIGGYEGINGFYATPEGNKHAIFVCAVSL
jgi:hypothetical protein